MASRRSHFFSRPSRTVEAGYSAARLGVGMGRRDPLRVLEAAWTFEASDEAWLKGVLDAARPYDVGRGSLAYVFELGRSFTVRSLVTTAEDHDLAHARLLYASIPSALLRRWHRPRPATYSGDIFEDVVR